MRTRPKCRQPEEVLYIRILRLDDRSWVQKTYERIGEGITNLNQFSSSFSPSDSSFRCGPVKKRIAQQWMRQVPSAPNIYIYSGHPS
jgi:hypothetical protein